MEEKENIVKNEIAVENANVISNTKEKDKQIEVSPEELKAQKKQKARKLTVSLIAFGIILIGLIIITFCRQIFGNEVGDAILGPGVPNGFVAIGNFFISKKDALIGTLVAIFIYFVIYYIISLIVKLTLHKTARRRTIASITRSFVKYMLVVIGIITILALWGVNVAGIFAGVGIAGLIIGLGCKSIVNDIVSGFFIVIDNYYQVGDKINVGGFEGDVISIGLRTTKIKDGIKIKSICNSQISSVININGDGIVTCKAKIEISYIEDIRHVEAVIAKNLPKIEKKIPALTKEIQYKGICEITDRGLLLEFSSKIPDGDKGSVEKMMLRELYLMLIDNDISMPFNKEVIINKGVEKKHIVATKEDIKLANELIKKINPKKVEVVQKETGLVRTAVSSLRKNLK